MGVTTLAQAIPLKVRKVIYSLLATAVGLEVVLDFIPAGLESKILGVLVVLGFGTAIANTPSPEVPTYPAPPEAHTAEVHPQAHPWED